MTFVCEDHEANVSEVKIFNFNCKIIKIIIEQTKVLKNAELVNSITFSPSVTTKLCKIEIHKPISCKSIVLTVYVGSV